MDESKLLQYHKPTQEENPSGTPHVLQGLIGFAASLLLATPGIALLILHTQSATLRITIFPGVQQIFVNPIFPTMLLVFYVALCVFAAARMHWREFVPGLISGALVGIFIISLLFLLRLLA